MIDYEKLIEAEKLAIEYYEQSGYPIIIELNTSIGCRNEPHLLWVNHVSFNFDEFEDLLMHLKELTQPKPKYELGSKVWIQHYELIVENYINFGWHEGEVIALRMSDLDLSEPQIRTESDLGEYLCAERFVYPNKQALIEAQIDYWTKLKQESQEPCQHESDEQEYYSGLPSPNHVEYRCTKCGEYYK